MPKFPRKPWEIVNVVIMAALVVTNGLLVRENTILRAELAPGRDRAARQELRPGDTLGPFEATGPGGNRLSLFDGRDSTSRLLFFFDTDCAYCRESVSYWNRLSGMAADRRLAVLGVSLDDVARTAAYVAESGVAFPVASADDPGYPEAQGIMGVPATVLVDGGGRVVKVLAGEVDADAFADMATALSPPEER